MVCDICAQVAAVACLVRGFIWSPFPELRLHESFENRELSRRNEALIWPLNGGGSNNKDAFCCYFLGSWLLFHVFVACKAAWKVMKTMDVQAQCVGAVLFQLVCFTLSLELPFSPLHCPHQLVPSSFVGDCGSEVSAMQLEWNWKTQAFF